MVDAAFGMAEHQRAQQRLGLDRRAGDDAREQIVRHAQCFALRRSASSISGSVIASRGSGATVCHSPSSRLEGAGCGAVDLLGFVLADQSSVWREHRIELQRPEEGVIAEVEAEKEPELDDLLFAVMLAQLVEERGVDRIWIGRHQFAVAQRQLLGGRELVALA